MFEVLREKCISTGARLIVVSKYQKNEDVIRIYSQNHRDFAENKVQELLRKKDELPSDIHWHLIGHLQTNKVKYIAPFISCIHSVDSIKLWREIDKQAKLNNRSIDILIQVKIAIEESKFGLSPKDTLDLLNSAEIMTFKNTNLIGLMGMASFTDDTDQIRKEFKLLKQVCDEAKLLHNGINEISMGMSSDYEIALEEGSTMLRIGTAAFQQ